jgi:hypothetical protein
VKRAVAFKSLLSFQLTEKLIEEIRRTMTYVIA